MHLAIVFFHMHSLQQHMACVLSKLILLQNICTEGNTKYTTRVVINSVI